MGEPNFKSRGKESWFDIWILDKELRLPELDLHLLPNFDNVFDTLIIFLTPRKLLEPK